jgi:SNF family Na+-dependent transporter
MESLFKDTYTQVFYSMGLCTGVHYAYGSFNHIKKPVILDSFAITTSGFIFSLLTGFMGWGAIGYLNAMNNPNQGQTSSVGLTYVAMPEAASLNDSVGMYIFFLVYMFSTGITQVYGFIMGFITNLTDYFKCSIWKAALPVCLCGILLTIAYTSNVGWILFDMTEHYILRYLLISVGFLQCVAVGWFFEYFSTAAASPNHEKALKILATMYWIPTIVICFYANFALDEFKLIGLLVICFFTLLALGCSYKASEMAINSFYHEIVLQGVDKLSMSITSLSNEDNKREYWMLPFETYFGICIKFVNPACLLFILFHNLQEDLSAPYND